MKIEREIVVRFTVEQAKELANELYEVNKNFLTGNPDEPYFETKKLLKSLDAEL